MKRVILVTGTPSVGKTTTSKLLTEKLSAEYINLTEYVKTNNLTLGEDEQRQTTIVNEQALTEKLSETIVQLKKENVVIDGHFAASVTPANLVDYVFVLRRNPKELKQQMIKSGFNEAKINENLAAEILDTCLVEALQTQKNVCEVDVTGKTIENVVKEIVEVLDNPKKCVSGFIDWLGLLEKEGLNDQYLKI